jgi:uncharacterized membrane protein
MIAWVAVNAILLISRGTMFDPYPFILLNKAEHDYEVNLEAEVEIMLLQEKIDALREKQWEELLTCSGSSWRCSKR